MPLATPEDSARRYEIVDGELFVTASYGPTAWGSSSQAGSTDRRIWSWKFCPLRTVASTAV